MASAAVLHLVAVLLLLGAAGAPAPTPSATPELRVVPIVDEKALPLVTDGEDARDGASVEAAPAPDLASGGEAPTPRLERAPEAGAEREQILAQDAAPVPVVSPQEATPSIPVVAPPEAPPPVPRRKPAPPAVTAARDPPPVPAAKPADAAADGADVLDPTEEGGGRRGSPDRSGNRYLALVRAEIERQRPAPLETRSPIAEGTAVFVLVIDRGGRLLVLQLRKSSGAASLDDSGAEMIRRAAPLPPLPPEIPGEAVELEVALALFPR
jgi:protein TonB